MYLETVFGSHQNKGKKCNFNIKTAKNDASLPFMDDKNHDKK